MKVKTSYILCFAFYSPPNISLSCFESLSCFRIRRTYLHLRFSASCYKFILSFPICLAVNWYIYILKKEDVEFYDQLPIIPLCFAGFSRQCQVGLRIFCQQSRRNQILDLKNMEWDLWRGRRYWIVIKAVKCKENSSSVVIGERLRRFHWVFWPREIWV